MAADAKRCPGCGADMPTTAPESLCPHCLKHRATTRDLPGPADAATTGRIAVRFEHSPPPTKADSDATQAHRAVPVAGAVDAGDTTLGPAGPTAITDDGDTATRHLARGTMVRYFGDYMLQKELGRGGMGVVYKARQVSLNRLVAIKMIKAGVLADADELRRFQNEAEAVARLDHARIVQVYEIGEHGGQRYFSMKLIEGGNLADRLASLKDSPRAAATLVAEAAEAVHHAHMRGILHRDLKPANILVDLEGHPNVSDFGLAKRVEADVEMTATGAILGTPSYMSPEQAAGRSGTITTATDVYGLGAILYALLTGKPPFGGESIIETLDAVRDHPPERPKRINASVPGDLETICLKCLEKDPRRRYSSAQALADDLHAWLDSRPIAARRVGTAERAWLWCRRRPAVAALSAAVLLALVGGAAATIAVQAKANRLLEKKNLDLQSANERVKERFDLANEAINLFHGEVGDDLVLKADQFKALRDKLLRGALAFYGKLEGLLKNQPDRGSRRAMGNAYFELGELTSKIGDKPAALAAHRKGLAIRQELASEPAEAPLARGNVAGSLYAVAGLLDDTGNSAEALAHYEKARELLEDLPLAGPGSERLRALLGAAYSGIGYVLANTGKADDAIPAFRRSVEVLTGLSDEHPAVTDFQSRLALTHQRFGVVLGKGGKHAEALESFRRALAVQEKLAKDNPSVTTFQSGLAANLINAAAALAGTGKAADALESYRQALAISEKLVEDNPAVTDFRSLLAHNNLNAAVLQSQLGMVPEALESYRRALAIYQKLVDDDPHSAELKRLLAITETNFGNQQFNAGKLGQALESYRRAAAILEKLAHDNPTLIEVRRRWADAVNNIGWVYKDTGQTADALKWLLRARAIYQKLVDDNPADMDFHSSLANCLLGVGGVAFQIGRWDEGLASSRRALAMHQKLASGNPSVLDFQSNLGDSLALVGLIMMTNGQDGEAMDHFSREEAIRTNLIKQNPSVPGFKNSLATCQTNQATALLHLGRPGEAQGLCDRAVGMRKSLLKGQPENVDFRIGQGQSLLRSGLARRAQGDLPGAVANWKQTDALFEEAGVVPPEATMLHAGCHAMLSEAAGRPSSGVSAAEADVARAMALVKRAADAGLRNLASYRTETALHVLRHRPDFQLLMMDLAFPAEPFAR